MSLPICLKPYWEQWEWRLWLSDPALSLCRPATRGIWIDALCAMMESSTDRLSATPDALARVCRCSVDDIMAAADDLSATEAAEVHRQQNGNITLISRKRRRDLTISEKRSFAGKVSATKRQQTPQHPSDCDCDCSSVSPTGREEGEPPWTREQWDAAAKHLGAEAEKVADSLWAHLDSQGWVWGNQQRVKGDPRSAFIRWLSKPERKLDGGTAGKPASAFELKSRIENADKMRGKLGAPTVHASKEQWDKFRETEKGKEWMKLGENIKSWRTQLAACEV